MFQNGGFTMKRLFLSIAVFFGVMAVPVLATPPVDPEAITLANVDAKLTGLSEESDRVNVKLLVAANMRFPKAENRVFSVNATNQVLDDKDVALSPQPNMPQHMYFGLDNANKTIRCKHGTVGWLGKSAAGLAYETANTGLKDLYKAIINGTPYKTSGVYTEAGSDEGATSKKLHEKVLEIARVEVAKIDCATLGITDEKQKAKWLKTVRLAKELPGTYEVWKTNLTKVYTDGSRDRRFFKMIESSTITALKHPLTSAIIVGAALCGYSPITGAKWVGSTTLSSVNGLSSTLFGLTKGTATIGAGMTTGVFGWAQTFAGSVAGWATSAPVDVTALRVAALLPAYNLISNSAVAKRIPVVGPMVACAVKKAKDIAAGTANQVKKLATKTSINGKANRVDMYSLAHRVTGTVGRWADWIMGR